MKKIPSTAPCSETAPSQAERRLAHEQALASTRIEGHVPTPEFLADSAALIAGTMTNDEARAMSLARALAKDLEARNQAAASPPGTDAD